MGLGGCRCSGAKSKELREALLEENHIITCTLQTFPEVVRLIEDDERLGDRSWAIIADEAHSSQSDSTASRMRGLLAKLELVDNEDEEVTAEDLLRLKDSAFTDG
ncbi:MAG: hypothetical protein Q4P72_07015 [Eubacteriales bacterium]|nr:hypothetical protein [Eubacteriales bacterium]